MDYKLHVSVKLQRDGGSRMCPHGSWVEGKDSIEANKLLKAADVWEDGTHLLSTFSFQALTTHTNSFNAHNNPHEMCPITTHSSTLRIMDPALPQSAHRSLKRTRYNYQVNFFQRIWEFWNLEGDGCGFTIKGETLSISSGSTENMKAAGEALMWSYRGLFWDSVSSCVQPVYWTRGLVPLGKYLC